MTIQAVQGNPNYPEYGISYIPPPIPKEQIEILQTMEFRRLRVWNCLVKKSCSKYPILKRLEKAYVDLEELDFPTKWRYVLCRSPPARYLET